MNGNDIYINSFDNKINNIINSNKDKPYLFGFLNYINDKSTTTKYNYINYILLFINYIGNKNIKDIEFDDYTNFLSFLNNKSSSYKIAVYSALKLFSTYLYKSKKISDDFMENIKRPKSTETETTRIKREKGYLNTKEIHKYLESVEEGVGNSSAIKKQNHWKERDLAIIQLFLTTGLRCSGLYKLDIDSIDFENKTLITTEKGDKIKTHNLSDQMLVILEQWIKKRNIILNGLDENALFISNQKKRINQSSIYDIVKKYAANINDKNITPHKLRATYGTQLYNKTKDIYFVQECMGHSNPSTTELYIRGNKNSNSQKAAEIMSSIIY